MNQHRVSGAVENQGFCHVRRIGFDFYSEPLRRRAPSKESLHISRTRRITSDLSLSASKDRDDRRLRWGVFGYTLRKLTTSITRHCPPALPELYPQLAELQRGGARDHRGRRAGKQEEKRAGFMRFYSSRYNSDLVKQVKRVTDRNL
jgi:hypothetical protein